MLSKLLLGNLKARDHLEHLGVDEKMILKCLLKKYGDTDWVEMAQDGTSGGSQKCKDFLV